MDRRTRVLVFVFGAVMVYLLSTGWVYPSFIKPLLTIDQRIAERNEILAELEVEEDMVTRAKAEYFKFLERDGSTEVNKVDLELRNRLNSLIEKHGLVGAGVSAPRPSDDKTGLKRLAIEITAEAPLSAAIAFLKDVSELPQLLQMGNVRLAKAGASAKNARDTDRVTLSLPLVLLVPPVHRLISPLDDSKLKPQESHVRHLGRDYEAIWNRKIFTEYEPAKPLVITMKPRMLTPKVGAPAQLQAMVSGGNGEYKYAWSPSEGLADASIPNPKVETATAGNRTYTLTVTDGRGQSASESITVNVQEAVAAQPPQPTQVVEHRPPPKPVPQPWPEGKFLKVNMIWTMFSGSKRSDELSINNTKTRTTDYYKVGDSFDGGELVFLHQRGAVGRRNDEYWLYPIGTTLDESVCEKDGGPHPELLDGAKRHRERLPSTEKGADAVPGTVNDVGFLPVLIGPQPPDPSVATQVAAEGQPTRDGGFVGPPNESAANAVQPEATNANAKAKPKARDRAGSMTGKGGTARKPAPGSGNAAGDAKSPPLDKKKEKAEPPAPD